jgi:hypothetical protein
VLAATKRSQQIDKHSDRCSRGPHVHVHYASVSSLVVRLTHCRVQVRTTKNGHKKMAQVSQHGLRIEKQMYLVGLACMVFDSIHITHVVFEQISLCAIIDSITYAFRRDLSLCNSN